MSHAWGASSLLTSSKIVDRDKPDLVMDGESGEIFFFLPNGFLFLGTNGQNFYMGLKEPNIVLCL